MSNEFDYTKLNHVTSVDQSDREVPYNLRQSGPTKVEMLISTRVRKSPYWHLSMQAGCWRATVYNRIYHPRGYVKPEDGGAMVEYEAIKNHVGYLGWDVLAETEGFVAIWPDGQNNAWNAGSCCGTVIDTVRGAKQIASLSPITGQPPKT